MVIETKDNEDILKSGQKHICFAVNQEGLNTEGFAGYISRHYWPELTNCGPQELGTTMTLERDGVYFHALVCHSVDGWKNVSSLVRKCFDNVGTDDPVASIRIGTSVDGLLSGVRFADVFEGMEDSKARIILY